MNVYARDGSGTLIAAPATVGYGSSGDTETFTYTAAAGGIGSGSVTVVVPAGWSAPSIVSGSAGYTVASTGTVAAAGQTITVSSVTLAGGATLTITYGSGVPVRRPRPPPARNVAGAVECDCRRRADESRRVAEHHGRTAALGGDRVPRRVRPLRHRLVDGRLRKRRLLRHRDRQLRAGIRRSS